MDTNDRAEPGAKNVTSTSLPVLDTVALAELRLLTGVDSPALQASFIDQYLASAPEILAAMVKAADTLEREGLRRLAHNLSATSAYVGAARVRDHAQRVERAALKETKQALQEKTAAIRAELEAAKAALLEARKATTAVAA